MALTIARANIIRRYHYADYAFGQGVPRLTTLFILHAGVIDSSVRDSTWPVLALAQFAHFLTSPIIMK